MSGALDEALTLFRKGDFTGGQAQTDKLLIQDLDNADLIYVNRCASFWANRFDEVASMSDHFEAGEYLITNWQPFLQYMQTGGYGLVEPFISTFKCLAFKTALTLYAQLYNPDTADKEPLLCARIGLCYKALGDYEKAVDFLRCACVVGETNADAMAQLADAYELYGEIRSAKAFFKEAFFLDARSIHLEFLESKLITDVVAVVARHGFTGDELLEWIPVYGYITSAFNVRRQLKSVEFGRLKQRVFMLENELQHADSAGKKLLVPRLITSYLWLIDKYSSPPISQVDIDNLLLKIKLLDKEIFAALVE